MTLTDRQRRFVEAYLLEPNATRAAIAAGYSPRTAEQAGSRLLRHVQVVAALAVRRRQLAVATGITPERVLAGRRRGRCYGCRGSTSKQEQLLVGSDPVQSH